MRFFVSTLIALVSASDRSTETPNHLGQGGSVREIHHHNHYYLAGTHAKYHALGNIHPRATGGREHRWRILT